MIFKKKTGSKARPTIGFDGETGLPKLPDGYTWEVSKNRSLDPHIPPYRIAIIRGNKVARQVYFSEMTDAGVRSAAMNIYRKFRLELEMLENEKRLIGTYPPNKLKGF